MLNPHHLRKDFPALGQLIHGHPLIYFDNAASTLKSKAVIERLNQHYRIEAANIHRGVHYLSEKGTMLYEETRRSVQNFINAKHTHEVIFTKGTTESINLVAESFGGEFLQAGDEIILSHMEHHSNIVPWQLMAEKVGAKILVIPVNDMGELDLLAFEKLLTPKTKMVSILQISNTLGTINPIKEMVQKAHAVGAKFMVDGAQSIAHIPVDVQDLDCDFFAFSSHKMYGPTGVGVLYGKEALLNQMPPYQGGGAMIDQVRFEKTTFNDLPGKFEAGTPHIAGVIAFKTALDYLTNIGLNEISAYVNKLLAYATEEIKSIPGIKIIGEARKKASILSFVMEGGHPHDIGTLLDQQGIAIRTGHHCTMPLMESFGVTATARASFTFYNTEEEIDCFIQALKKIKTLL